MARERNKVESVAVQVLLTPSVHAILESIVRTGLMSRTTPALCEELIRAGLNSTLSQDSFLSAKIKKVVEDTPVG